MFKWLMPGIYLIFFLAVLSVDDCSAVCMGEPEEMNSNLKATITNLLVNVTKK